jgi:hypothetical protein
MGWTRSAEGESQPETIDSSVSSVAVCATSADSFGNGLVAMREGRLYLVPLSGELRAGRRLLGGLPPVSTVATFGPSAHHEAVVATADGELIHLRIEDDEVLCAPIARFGPVRDIAGVSAPDSGGREKYLLVVSADGVLYELRLDGHRIVRLQELGRLEAARIAAFPGGDGERNGLVATRDGSLLWIRLDDDYATREVLARLQGVQDVTGFVSRDGLCHALAATAQGGVVEITSSASLGRREVQMRTPQDAARIAAACDAASSQGRLLLATRAGTLHILHWADPVAVSSAALEQLDASQPWLDDLSPPQPAGASPVSVSSAGSMLAVAGTSHRLYAVSWNAGVWTSSDGGGWYQIHGSPPFAYCIAVDPADDSHVVIGERPGDVAKVTAGATRLWETTDAGYSWQQVSLAPPAGCQALAVTFLFFSNASTLYIGTACGAGRRRASDQAASFVTTSGRLKRKPGNATPIPALGPVTAFSESVTAAGSFRIWTRTPTELLFSDDDGATWTAVDVPAMIGGYDSTGTNLRQGDLFSLAAFGDSAFFFFKPGPNTSPPIAQQTGNSSTLIFYNDLAQSPFSVQVLPTGDGTGAGGKRVAKSYLAGLQPSVFFSAAQDLYEGTIQPDATVAWRQPLGRSPVAGGGDFHSEVWDFHVTADGRAWVATDGGLFRKDPSAAGWVAENDFLHTHHIQSVTALPTGALEPNIAYATHDNGPWARGGAAASWSSWLAEDITFSAGDAAVPGLALLVRHRETATVTTFGGPPPPGAVIGDQDVFPLNFYKRTPGKPPPINPPNSFGGTSGESPITLQVIQTLAGEAAKPLLDVVMLADLPLTRFDGTRNVPFHPDQVLGRASPRGNPVLIRSQSWCASPRATDGFDEKFWQLEDGNMPAGTFGFCVSGGHADPVFYACANRNKPLLFRRASSGMPWVPVTGFQGSLLPGGQYGPVFANPYDSNHLYVLTDQGVQFSTDGASTFQVDAVLTGLVTGAGQFQLSDVFTGGNFSQVLQAGGFFSISAGCLAHMAFLRDNPAEVVAVSPFTGVFYNNGDKSGASWRDLSSLLPTPLPRASSVAITDDAIYIGASGRGLLRISNYRSGFTAFSVRIRMLGIDECGVGPSQGGIAVFAADAQGFTAPLTYEWTVTGGTRAAAQPPYPGEFAVDLPATAATVTVHVAVTDADGRAAAADFSHTPGTEWMGRLIDLICHLRKLPLNPWQVNPLGDPVPDPEVLAAMLRDIAETKGVASAIANLSGQLLDELQRLEQA